MKSKSWFFEKINKIDKLLARLTKKKNKQRRTKLLGFLRGSVVKNPPANAEDMDSIPGPGRSPGNRMAPTPVFLPGKSHGQRSLAGYSARDHKELHTTQGLEQHQ